MVALPAHQVLLGSRDTAYPLKSQQGTLESRGARVVTSTRLSLAAVILLTPQQAFMLSASSPAVILTHAGAQFSLFTDDQAGAWSRGSARQHAVILDWLSQFFVGQTCVPWEVEWHSYSYWRPSIMLA